MSGTIKPRPRRRKAARALYRIGLWLGVPVLILGSVFCAIQLTRSPHGQLLLQSAADRLIQGTGLLGLTVSEITVEGRETTDRETILSALAAGPGTPILPLHPPHPTQHLHTLPST